MVENSGTNLYKRSIGIIGLGLMGSPMAQQPNKADAKLHIWNRNSQTTT
jgi:3-hydroxyisobutyrate dehydrogenase-like beta-hydroxyacid dehydrogenase